MNEFMWITNSPGTSSVLQRVQMNYCMRSEEYTSLRYGPAHSWPLRKHPMSWFTIYCYGTLTHRTEKKRKKMNFSVWWQHAVKWTAQIQNQEKEIRMKDEAIFSSQFAIVRETTRINSLDHLCMIYSLNSIFSSIGEREKHLCAHNYFSLSYPCESYLRDWP